MCQQTLKATLTLFLSDAQHFGPNPIVGSAIYISLPSFCIKNVKR